MLGQIELEDYLRSLQKESLNILDYIKIGRENAVTRAELSKQIGISDRQVRDLSIMQEEIHQSLTCRTAKDILYLTWRMRKKCCF